WASVARARAEVSKNDSGSHGAVTPGPYHRSGAGTPEHIFNAIKPAISYRLSGAGPMGIAFGFRAGRPGRQHANRVARAVRSRRVRSADRLRESGESAAGPLGRPSTRNRSAARPRRRKNAADHAIAR